MSSEKNHLVLGTRKGLIILERSGQAWKVIQHLHPGKAISYCDVDVRNGTLWACIDHGHWGQKLSRSTDRGESWQEIEAPKYPEGAILKEDKPAALSYLWVVTPGHEKDPDRIYIGTEPGGLFVSEDGGENFSLVESLWNHPSRLEGHWFGGGRDEAGIHSILIDPRDSNHVYVGVSCAGVFETTDGGKTWQPRNKGLNADFLPNPDAEVGQDPHLIVFSPSNPDVMWQQNHCGIYRSVDGAKNWELISEEDGSADFGFPIAVCEKDSETAWVVPAVSDGSRLAIDGALCVCRTEDGGKSWTPLREGLPQRNCSDIVYRHALDIAGDQLVFGSTTGNVYFSENRGDSWRCLGNHFPPVYSTRFVTL